MIETTLTASLVLAVTMLGLGVLIGYGLGRHDTRAAAPTAPSEAAVGSPQQWVPPASGWAPTPVQAPAPPNPPPAAPLPLLSEQPMLHTPLVAVSTGRHHKPEPGRADIETTRAMPTYPPSVEVT